MGSATRRRRTLIASRPELLGLEARTLLTNFTFAVDEPRLLARYTTLQPRLTAAATILQNSVRAARPQVIMHLPSPSTQTGNPPRPRPPVGQPGPLQDWRDYSTLSDLRQGNSTNFEIALDTQYLDNAYIGGP